MPTGVKTGGRQKGTPNKVHADLRKRIEEEGDPVGFMLAVARGEIEFDSRTVEGKPCKIKPNSDQRINAAKWLGDKILPSLKAMEMTDPNGDALKLIIQIVDHKDIADTE